MRARILLCFIEHVVTYWKSHRVRLYFVGTSSWSRVGWKVNAKGPQKCSRIASWSVSPHVVRCWGISGSSLSLFAGQRDGTLRGRREVDGWENGFPRWLEH